ncbi:MAG: Crp/Fnr family transcriptional regulator [Clostridia bacterium]
MNNITYNLLTEKLHINDYNIITLLEKSSSIIHLKKNEILFHQDFKPEYIAFLINGIMRSFIFDDKGATFTDCFDYEYGWPVVPSVPMNAPASVNIEACVESSLILFPVEDIVKLIDTNMEISRIYNSLMIKSVQKHVELTRALLQKDAAQRYQWFLSEYAEIEDKVDDKYIASFLHMTPVTLCRIKRDLKNRSINVVLEGN